MVWPHVPTRFGAYEILYELKTGGMGAVLLGRRRGPGAFEQLVAIKAIDFGIALVKNRQAPVTEFGTVKGKPPYMSPEQIKNEAMDRRSDVFSLAVVLWELLTQQGLFDGDSIYAIARSVEHQEIKPP